MLQEGKRLHFIVHTKVHKGIVKAGHVAEHPCAILYAFVDAMEGHGLIAIISIMLVITGLLSTAFDLWMKSGAD